VKPRARNGRVADQPAGERGAIMVEFVVVVLVIVTLGLGAFEFGWAWRTRTAADNATRDGARTLSSLGTDQLADYEALEATRTSLSSAGLLASVQRVVIFKSTTSDGRPPAACTSGGSTGALCHVITGAQLQSMTQASFDGNGCLTAAIVKNYCPTGRSKTRGSGDYVGLWVSIDHRMLTQQFGSDLTVTARTVMRLEPL
jgi:hypothetical protein